MTDKEMIEEMARVIFERGVALDGIDFVFGLNGSDHFERIATAIYNAGYRKIPEDSVVMTREYYNEMVDDVKVSKEKLAHIIDSTKAKTRKETAREILKDLVGHTMEDDGWSWTVNKEDIQWLAEKYDVEVEE